MSIIRITKEQVVNAQKAKQMSFNEDMEFKALEEEKERDSKKAVEKSEKEAK